MEVIKKIVVSYYPSGKKPLKIVAYFDSGSPYTFIKKSSVLKLGKPARIIEPVEFRSLGDGKFLCEEYILLHVKMLKFWCKQLMYVVEDKVLGENYDILIGHDFMQLYGVSVIPHKRDIEIDEMMLELAQTIR